MTDTDLTPGGTLHCIVSLTRDPTVETFALRPLTAPEVTKVMPSIVLGARTEPRQTTVFERVVGSRPEPISSDWPALVLDLAESVRCIDLAVGPAVFRDAAVARDVLAALCDDG
jgi:hypothetical protein